MAALMAWRNVIIAISINIGEKAKAAALAAKRNQNGVSGIIMWHGENEENQRKSMKPAKIINQRRKSSKRRRRKWRMAKGSVAKKEAVKTGPVIRQSGNGGVASNKKWRRNGERRRQRRWRRQSVMAATASEKQAQQCNGGESVSAK
jgi:hypothetical protein